MIRVKSNSQAEGSAMGLFMECEEDELSAAQVAHYDNVRKEYEDFHDKVAEFNMKKRGKIIIEDRGHTLIESVLESPGPKKNIIIQLNAENITQKVKPIKVTLKNTAVVPKTKILLPKSAESVPVIISTVASKPVVRSHAKPNAAYDLSEVTSVGGLSYGNKIKKSEQRDPFKDQYSKLGDGDNEITMSKTQGKTYPSLMCVARPRLNPKAGNLTVSQSDRSVLDAQVKGFLMLPASQFCEWLMKQGLVRNVQYCTHHLNADKTPVKMQLITNGLMDLSKFVFSGGYTWFGDCCKFSQLISVFNGSIFEGSFHPPAIILKLIYHWACQTNIPNVLQWVKVDTLYIRNFYALLRAICVLAIRKKQGLLGGYGKRIEVGVLRLRTSQKMNGLCLDVDIIAVLEPEAHLARLRAIKLGRIFEVELARFITETVDPASIICCDHACDVSHIVQAGFRRVDQDTLANKVALTYLRETVLKIFPASIPMTSTVILQQFLDELAWRERWGSNSMDAFSVMLKHIGEFTSESSEGLIRYIIPIASNPWNTEVEDTSNVVKALSKRRGSNETYVAIPLKKKTTSQQVVIYSKEYDWWPLRKVTIPSEFAMHLHSAGSLLLESYYYGIIYGNLSPPNKHTIKIKCAVCERPMLDCFSLMAHMVLHFQTVPAISGPLTRVCQCLECFVGFMSVKELSHHIDTHSGAFCKLRSCAICEVRFVSPPQTFYHMYRYHVQMELPYVCELCGFRCSSFNRIVSHIKVHQWDSYIFCPFCLKTVKIIGENGVIRANVGFFAKHIRRHQTVNEACCKRCRLRFVHSSLLEKHLENHHVSLNGHPDVQPITGSGSLVMPAPISVAPPPPRVLDKPDRSVWRFTATPFHLDLCIGSKQICIECEGIISQGHYIGRTKCNVCTYTSNCTQAVLEHHKIHHDSNSPRVLFSSVVPRNNSMYCACGFYSHGNHLAKHLVQCNETTAYSTIPSFKDELTVLNTVGLVRKSPEPVEKSKGGDNFVQSSESFINIVSVSSLNPSSSAVEPPVKKLSINSQENVAIELDNEISVLCETGPVAGIKELEKMEVEPDGDVKMEIPDKEAQNVRDVVLEKDIEIIEIDNDLKNMDQEPMEVCDDDAKIDGPVNENSNADTVIAAEKDEVTEVVNVLTENNAVEKMDTAEETVDESFSEMKMKTVCKEETVAEVNAAPVAIASEKSEPCKVESEIMEENVNLSSVNVEAVEATDTIIDNFEKQETSTEIIGKQLDLVSVAEESAVQSDMVKTAAVESVQDNSNTESISLTLDPPECVKTEVKEATGSLIEELENIMDSTEPTTESPDFISDLIDPPTS